MMWILIRSWYYCSVGRTSPRISQSKTKDKCLHQLDISKSGRLELSVSQLPYSMVKIQVSCTGFHSLRDERDGDRLSFLLLEPNHLLDSVVR
jgi:hypothetical protein